MLTQNIQLTKNFKLHEFLVTNTGAYNEPPTDVINNIKALAKKLQKLRDKVGRIYIQSGYRSPEVQAALTDSGNVQVSKTSLHLSGKAADITFGDTTAQEAYFVIWSDPELNEIFGEVALKTNLIHISDLAPEKNINTTKWMEVDSWGQYLSVYNVDRFLQSRGVDTSRKSEPTKTVQAANNLTVSSTKQSNIGLIIGVVALLSVGTFFFLKK